MAKPSAIADATFIAYSFELEKYNIRGLITNLFSEILIPSEVRNELLNTKRKEVHAKRQRFIEELPVGSGYYKLCTSYESIVFEEVVRIDKIDKGEAESIAQMRKRGVRFFLSDDKGFQHLPESYKDLKRFNMPTIIGLFDLNGFIKDYQQFIQDVHFHRPLNSTTLRKGYLEAARYLGVNISKKNLYEKTSLKKLGIT